MKLKGIVSVVSRVVQLTPHSLCHGRHPQRAQWVFTESKPNSASAEAALSQGLLAGQLGWFAGEREHKISSQLGQFVKSEFAATQPQLQTCTGR